MKKRHGNIQNDVIASMSQREIIDDAKPDQYFSVPPYRAELLNELSGWSGVMNKNGVNCLTFKSKAGVVVSDFESCRLIAEKFNNEGIVGD
jgi:hypothetical protein